MLGMPRWARGTGLVSAGSGGAGRGPRHRGGPAPAGWIRFLFRVPSGSGIPGRGKSRLLRADLALGPRAVRALLLARLPQRGLFCH